MNSKYYDDMFDTFAQYYPETARHVDDFRPVSNFGIRLTLNDGSLCDFDVLSKGLKRVKEGALAKNEITDDLCRESFSVHLCELMRRNGFNQQTLSDYTGISKGSINAYLNKSKTPSLTNVRKIACVLNGSVAELME